MTEYADNNWISVKLRLPRVGQTVYALSHKGVETLKFTGLFVPWVSHWQPI
jgi:hypothetical protein